MKLLLQGFIRLYQVVLSAVLGPRCRFYPSCSNYAIEAIEVHGIARGSLLSAKRFCKCHPFNPGGFDPVPGTATDTDSAPDSNKQPTPAT